MMAHGYATGVVMGSGLQPLHVFISVPCDMDNSGKEGDLRTEWTFGRA
jgi:hypothetical protein